MQATTTKNATGTKARRVIINTKKPASAKAPTGTKPATAVKPASVPNAKPAIANAKPASAADLGERAQARLAAAKAVAAFYAGKSLPFKSAFDLKRKAPINPALTRDPSARTAGLIAAILTYCDVAPNGSFVRGSGRVPGKLLGFTGADATRLFNAGPESGCLSNCMPDRIAYVSGPLSGAGCENAIFQLNLAACRANMLAHNEKQTNGEHLFSAPIGLLDLLTGSKPAKRTATKPAGKR